MATLVKNYPVRNYPVRNSAFCFPTVSDFHHGPTFFSRSIRDRIDRCSTASPSLGRPNFGSTSCRVDRVRLDRQM